MNDPDGAVSLPVSCVEASPPQERMMMKRRGAVDGESVFVIYSPGVEAVVELMNKFYSHFWSAVTVRQTVVT